MLTENIENFTSEYKKRESSLDDLLINYVNKNLIGAIEKFRNAISEDIASSQLKTNKDTNKNNILDWQKKQISDLQQYKAKVIGNENKVENLEKENKILNENLAVIKDLKEQLESLNTKKDEKITKINQEITELKIKFKDIHRYVEHKCKDSNFIALYKKHFMSDNE